MISNETLGTLAAVAVGLFGLVTFLKNKKDLPNQGEEIAGFEPVSGKTVTLDDIYRQQGIMWGVDWRLLKAIAIVESNENPNAVNPSDPSTGLMQVLCVGSSGNDPCTNKFNVIGWERATHNALFDPEFNVSIAAQILRWNQDTYGFTKGIAVYNNWSARHDAENGPFRNQQYVEKVMSNFTAIVSANPE